MIFSDPAADRQLIKSRLLTLIDNLSGKSLLALLEKAEQLPLKGNRKDLRKICSMKVTITFQGQEQQGTAHDISYSGLFIGSNMPISSGNEISLSFLMNDEQQPTEISGEIMRTNPRGGGVKFKNLSAEQKEFVKNLVDSL